jgi:hypothetical protein
MLATCLLGLDRQPRVYAKGRGPLNHFDDLPSETDDLAFSDFAAFAPLDLPVDGDSALCRY